jgi:hypothetical protein
MRKVEHKSIATNYSNLNESLYVEQKNYPISELTCFYTWNNINCVTRDEYTIAIFKVKPKQLNEHVV